MLESLALTSNRGREKEKPRENKRLKRLNQPRAGGGFYTQLLWPDRSDRSRGPVRPVGSAAALYMSSINGGVSFFDPKSSLRCLHVDEDPVRGFGGSTKPG